MSLVLVVDDESGIRDLVRRYLEREGHQMLTAATAAEALDVSARVGPDLVVLDVRLPDLSGVEVARELRATSDVPIVMLTAEAEERDRIEGLEVGADDMSGAPHAAVRPSPRAEPTGP